MEMENDINTFFEPEGIVLVGARRSPGFGYGIPFILRQRGWGQRLFLVNPNGGEIDGMPLYKSASEVPGPIDLGIVVVPAPSVPKVLSELGQLGVRHIIIETAGFAEAGEKGIALQAEVEKVRKKHDLRIIGPNCIGIVNNVNGFSTNEILPEAFPQGVTSIIAQSGVFGNILLDKLYALNLFICKAITLGNRMDIDECDMLDYLHRDPETRLIMLYLEGAADGRRLRETLARVSKDKPVLVLKSGRTDQGRAATASHTGSLSGVDSLYTGMLDQAGAIRAESLDELITLARIFATQPLPQGNRLGIVTGSGSMGALATDSAVVAGLETPQPSAETIEKVKAEAPEWMNVKNPLDVGPSGQFKIALSAMLQDPGIDMVMAITTIPHSVFRSILSKGITGEQIFGNIPAIRSQEPEKPFLICVVAHDEIYDHMIEIAGSHIPVVKSPEMAAKGMAALWRYRNIQTDNPK